MLSRALSSGGRDRHDRRGGLDRGRGSHGLGRGPSGDHVRSARDRRPSNLRRIVARRGEVQPSARPRTGDESNNPRAICSVAHPDTSNPPPAQIQHVAYQGGHELPAAVVAVQF